MTDSNTDSNEEVLRRSLDAVDRHRTRLLIGIAVTTVVLLGVLVYGGHTAHGRNPNAFLHAVMLVLGVWTTLMALVVVVQMTVMTKRILRAIELASRR